MPERLRTIYRQANKVLGNLEHELTLFTQRLTELKAEAQKWETILGGEKGRKPYIRRSRQRVNWQQIFSDLPQNFTVQDVVERSGKDKNNAYVILSR